MPAAAGAFPCCAVTMRDGGEISDRLFAYSVDIDKDGVDELVCRYDIESDGARIIVFRNNNGAIERGTIDTGYDADALGISLGGIDSYSEVYDAEFDTFYVDYTADGDVRTESFKVTDLEIFDFISYGHSED